MSKREFIRRADVEDGDHAGARIFQELLARDRLHTVTVVEVAADHALHFGNIALGDPAQRCHEIEHSLIGERVEDELPLASCRYDAGAPHVLQVLRRVGDGEAGSLRDHLDGALALRQLL